MEQTQHDLLIIYTSKNGRTGAMMEPIRQGMLEGGASVEVRTVDEVQWDEMLAAKGIIVGNHLVHVTRGGGGHARIVERWRVYFWHIISMSGLPK